jgi:hypothetical protein
MQPDRELSASFYQSRWSLVQSPQPAQLRTLEEETNYFETNRNHSDGHNPFNSLFRVLPVADTLDTIQDVIGCERNSARVAGANDRRHESWRSNQAFVAVYVPAWGRDERHRTG